MGKSYVKPDEILLVDGSWSIVRSFEPPSDKTVRPEWFHDNTKSYIKHRCKGERAVGSIYIWPRDGGRTHVACWRCDDPIPDGIKGTWIMHNWEALQNER